MESKLLIHPKTNRQIETFLTEPFHFLIISGPTGAGKTTLAKFIASQLLSLSEKEDIEKSHHFFHIMKPEDKKDIPIEAVRTVLKGLNLKSTSDKKISRVVYIENGQLLNRDTQNTLLKTLEEPPAATVFIISVDFLSNLLPTIVSRAQTLEVHPLSLEDAAKFFDSDNVPSAWALSEGNAGMMSALINSDDSSDIKISVARAKKFLGSSVYERLCDSEVQKMGREDLSNFLNGLKRVIKAIQRSAIENQKTIKQTKLIKARQLINELQEALAANTSPKLVYLTLVQKLKL